MFSSSPNTHLTIPFHDTVQLRVHQFLVLDIMETHIQDTLREIDAAIAAVRLESHDGERRFSPQIAEIKVARLQREREWLITAYTAQEPTMSA